MSWLPAAGLNLILGGGDAGKSTVLDAIALLLTPSNAYTLSDSDYFLRDVEAGFCIEAVLALPDDSMIHRLSIAAWPWEWDGDNAVLPSNEAAAQRAPVYRLRVRGTPELDIVHDLVQPDGNTIGLSLSLRRDIGIVRIGGDERGDRDLRLIQGGGLDRLLDDANLRARLGRKIAIDAVEDELAPQPRARLENLDTTFQAQALPSGLGLGFIGGSGLSINALVGLTAKKDEIALPITSWGSGTRRLASLAIASATRRGVPITVVDEIERGLEPYRQRKVVESIQSTDAQSFLTTHSLHVISAASAATLWYVDSRGCIGELQRDKVGAQQQKDPEAFLSRLTIVAEGATEVGFIAEILTRFVSPLWKSHGLHISDGGGNESVLKLLEALSSGGLEFAGMADTEAGNPNPQRWERVAQRLGPLLMRWPRGCIEENLIPMFGDEGLDNLIADPVGNRSGMRRRTLADRLGIDDTSLEAIRHAAGERLMQLVVEAATGFVPTDIANDRDTQAAYKSHARTWFKSIAGGAELAAKMIDLNVWPIAAPLLLPFLNALRFRIGAGPLEAPQ